MKRRLGIILAAAAALAAGLALAACSDLFNDDGLSDAVKSVSVTVTFDANGGTGTMAAQTIIAGTATVLTANAFTREGYTFLGWSLSNSATTATYADGESVTMTGDATLYAVWGVTATFTATFLSGDISATFTKDKLGNATFNEMANTATAVLTSLPSSQQTGGTYAWYFADNETPVSTTETCTFAYQSTSGANVITKNCVYNKAYQLVLTYTVDGITYSAFYQVSFRQKQ